MGRARLGALIGVAVVGGILAIGLANCAEPTQIEIDVRTDACGVIKNAGIAVTTPDRIDTAELTIFTPDRPDNQGCESKPADRVGTLIIYPSGSKDAEVGIRIVGGIGRTAQECKPGNYAGCVVARRIESFVEGTTKKVIVILSRACEGKDCGLGKECNQDGACVVNLPDGGKEDGGTLDAQILPDAPIDDGPTDAPVGDVADAAVDACVACTGAGRTCNAGQCAVDCTVAGAGACANTVCGAGLDCTFDCNALNACQGSICAAGAKSCRFNCNAGQPACKDVTCVAPNCHVQCEQGGRCDGTFTLGGGDASIVCNGNQSCDDVTGVSCNAAGNCFIDCDPGSCPPKKCDGGTCTGDWDAAAQ
jgi:hypothetical protein